MDIEKLEKLEKLNELKEKGLLTQEEFDAEKKKLLQPAKPKIEKKIEILSQENIKENSSNENSEKNRKFSWKNFFLSLFITVIFLLLFGFIAVSFGHSTEDFKGIYKVLTLFVATLFALYAIKKETYKYKNGAPAFGVFIGIAFLGPIGIWLISYQFLQIKNGFAEIKEIYKERNKIITGIGIVFLFGILALVTTIFYTKIKHNFNENSPVSENVSNNLIDADWWKTATLNDIKRELANGADINAKGNDKTKSGYLRTNVTPLVFALKYGNSDPKIIKLLINSGANVNAKEGEIGLTVLMYAAQFCNNPDIIDILISAGANVNAKKKSDGGTALIMAAIWNDNPQITKTLIENGADVQAKDNKNKTALDYAKEQKKEEVIAILKQAKEENTPNSNQSLTIPNNVSGDADSDSELSIEQDISPSQKDIYILKQTVKNIKKTFSKGFYTGLANTPNLSPSATHSGGGRILYSDFDTSWIEIDYQDVPIELCIQIAQQDYSFLADYEGIFMRIYGPNNEGTHEIYVNWEDGILSKEKAQQMCQACGGNCTISWIFGPRENEDEDYSDEYDSEQVDEVVWNDGKPQDATQAYRDASAEDRLSFNATFTGCLAQEKFNMQMQDALPLEAQFAMAFSGGSNTSRQCSCIFNAVKEYLGDEEFQQARKFRQQGRDGSADKIYEKALPAAFGSCF